MAKRRARLAKEQEKLREENPTEWFAEQERKKRIKKKEMDKKYYRKKKGLTYEQEQKHPISEANTKDRLNDQQETTYIEEKTLGWSELTPEEKKVSIERYLMR